MPLPKQALVPEDRIMKAPYNFVPLPNAVLTVSKEKQENTYDTRKHTGLIELTITTETLLYTRCAYPPATEDEKVYRSPSRQQFFHHGNPERPYLPGSSIRGMLRSLMEIITYSRIGNVHNSRLIYRAVGDTSALGTIYKGKMFGNGLPPIPYPLDHVRGGYLRIVSGQMFIQPAIQRNGETFVHTVSYPAFAPGRLGNPPPPYGPSDVMNVWLIPPASRAILPARNHRPSLSIAEVQNTAISDSTTCPTTKAGWVRGTLVRSGSSPRKHRHCVIYEGNPNQNEWMQIDPSLWEIYKQDRDTNRGIPARKLENDGDPLFYLMDGGGGLVFFGPTQLFRLPYESDTIDMIPSFLKNPDDLDMTEALFGSTERKGRIRVMDAALTAPPEDGQIFLAEDNGRMIPKILSSPKPTSFQNYLVQPAAGVPKATLKHYDTPFGPNGNGTVIRGYKYYWNKPTDENSVKESGDRVQIDVGGLRRFRNTGQHQWRDTTDPNAKPQHTVIKPVRPGCVFGGRICFENLSDLELGALLTALRLEDTNSRHRLGMGKPYGMGRIRIEYVLHLDDRKARYHAMDAEGRKRPDEVSQIVQTCLASFSQKIMDHHITCCGGSSAASIWGIPRLKDLSLLMKQQGPNLQDACYASLDDPKPWRDRNVLPAPQQVMNCSPDETAHGAVNVVNSGAVGPQHPALALQTSAPVKNGQKVTCVVLEEQTKKKKWRFRVKDGEGIGTMHPSSLIPDDIEPGKEYLLMVFSDNPKNMTFTWKP